MFKKIIKSLFIIIISVNSIVYGDGVIDASTSNFGNYFMMAFSFLLVLVLTYCTTKFIGARTSLLKNTDDIKVLSQKVIDKNNKIVIAKIVDDYYVLGVSTNNISVIKELEEKDFDNMNFTQVKKGTNQSFSTILVDAINKKIKLGKNKDNKEDKQ